MLQPHKLSLFSGVITVRPEKSRQMSIKFAQNDSIRKRKILQKLPKNFDNLGKIIVDAGFQKLPKVQFIAQSGHTGCEPPPKQQHDWPTYLFTYQRDQMLV